MGTQYHVTCKHCGTAFAANNGGGMRFHLLHCEQCGQEHALEDQEMGPTFTDNRRPVNAWITANVQPCPCGGRFTFDAKARCPKCKSDDWSEENATAEIDYD